MRRFCQIIILLTINLSITMTHAQMKEFYTKIDQLVWVVDDLEKVKSGWQKLGFNSFIDHGISTVTDELGSGKKVKHTMHSMTAYLGGLRAIWIQPVKGKCIYADYLKKNGPGALVILHRISSLSEIDAEIERMKNLGVEVLQKGSMIIGNKEIRYVYFDTFKKGRYILGLSYHSDETDPDAIVNQYNLQFSQVAFAVKNIDAVKSFWTKLGFPEFNMVYPDSWDKEYYEEPADYEMELAFQHPGDIAYEWCIPLAPPNVYADHIEKFGEGIQHFGFNVADMDKMLQIVKDHGLAISQSGGWGEKGKPGSGRFAYVNMEEWGGETIELLWSYHE